MGRTGLTRCTESHSTLSIPFLCAQATFAFIPILNLGQEVSDTDQDVVLDVSILADIFAANITNWRDPRIIESLDKAGRGDIAKMMPDANITVRNG